MDLMVLKPTIFCVRNKVCEKQEIVKNDVEDSTLREWLISKIIQRMK